ncbi:LON peptidase substrate-binding domain-containing protein [Hymenobacter ginsengisoli]|uniref:LON peptidase substrate-binding domain-containing protein n=1 Tax=Hymenobacter ginsengisoli TaxID=1051626 RepID=A0ABP8Q9H8_9BACT|nr:MULTISPECIES: LON peptidase substrate-binding domain-containing protein [unclassified Hymenobacter]MBO2030863.1 LON peptidase substrate-binding domain-containing protein [Hymenobacter sp. BT559]
MRLLPLFPLNLVAFPGEKLNLHIFEPRYRQLVRDCLGEGLTFGIPPFLDNAVQELGTEMRLLSIEKTHPGGEMDIRTEAIRVFRVEKFFRQAPGKLYAAGQVEDVVQDEEADPALREVITRQVRQLYEALGLRKLLLQLDPKFRIFDVAHHIGLSTEQEYQLLGTTAEQERQELVREHLERLLPAVLEAERLKERVKQNGHFKHLLPPQF